MRLFGRLSEEQFSPREVHTPKANAGVNCGHRVYESEGLRASPREGPPSLRTENQELIRMSLTTYLEAIRQGIWEEMERDPSVFCLGEDIGIYGGAFKV